jgi:hypothetical protein
MTQSGILPSRDTSIISTRWPIVEKISIQWPTTYTNKSYETTNNQTWKTKVRKYTVKHFKFTRIFANSIEIWWKKRCMSS